MHSLPTIKKNTPRNKIVLLRLDLDVPCKNGRIVDDTRLKNSWPTVKLLLENQNKVIVLGHLGRSEGRVDPDLSLLPVARWIGRELKTEIGQFPSLFQNLFPGWRITENLTLLENLRFFPGEEKNDPKFVCELSKLGEVFVNEAFAVCHRSHASVSGLPKYLPARAGLRLAEEVKVLSAVLKKPRRPLAVIIGGAKIETKLPVVENFHHLADYVLVGGEISSHTKALLKLQSEKERKRKAVLLVADLTEAKKDITVESALNFTQVLEKAATIVWNGPLGVFEEEANEAGSKRVAQAVARLKAYKVIGGGETIEMFKKFKFLGKIDWVSGGGGAMLEFLAGRKLPGLETLTS